MTNIEIIDKARNIVNDQERPEILPLEDIGTISAALAIARILACRTAEDDKAREEGRLVELSVPMLPMVNSDNQNDCDVYCPRCNHDLAGGWRDSDPDKEWKMCQCPNCGQSIDDCAVMTREEAAAALEGGAGENG